MDPPRRAESLSDPQEDDTQKHLQLEAVENSSRATAFPNAEISVNLPCSVTETHMCVLNARSAPSSSGAGLHLRTEVPEHGIGTGVLRAGDAYQWPNSSISYAPLISSPLLNHFYGNQACPPPKTNSMASEHDDGGFTVPAQQISTRNNTTQVKEPTGKEDSQHCSCKKSNCLKLYCDCFASGSFCVEACRCKECYNKHEYEDTVSESKERIQSRMPHAFAPKIIFQNSSRDTRNMTATSSRHRVGCNCRKSMCTKNYCECFKAHVGCSSVCRCEDCKNSFGVKDASGEMDGELETAKVNSEMKKPEQCHTSFPRLTPSIQSSIGNVPNPSVAPATSVLSSYRDSWNSRPIDSISTTSFAKAAAAAAAAGRGRTPPTFSSYYRASAGGSSSHDAVENFGTFLPHRDNFAGGGIVLGPPPDPELLQLTAFEGRDHHLSVNSLPLTGESINELEPDSNSGLLNYEIIMKDSSSTVEAVKTSSPNQESLSPPH